MGSLIRSELYRLKKQKSSWILLLVAFGMSAFFSASFGFLFGNVSWVQSIRQEMDRTYLSFGLENPLNTLSSSYNFTVSERLQFVTLPLTRELMLLMAAFTAFFTVRKRSTGYLRYEWTDHSEVQRFLSEAVVLFLYGLLLLLTGALAALLVSFLFFCDLSFGNAGAFLLYLLLSGLLYLTVSVLMTEFCERHLHHRNTGLIAVFFYLAFGSSMLYSVTDSLIQKLFRTDFYVEYILPLGTLDLLTYGKSDTYLAAAVVTVLFMTLAILIRFVFRKNKEWI